MTRQNPEKTRTRQEVIFEIRYQSVLDLLQHSWLFFLLRLASVPITFWRTTHPTLAVTMDNFIQVSHIWFFLYLNFLKCLDLFIKFTTFFKIWIRLVKLCLWSKLARKPRSQNELHSSLHADTEIFRDLRLWPAK